MNSVIKKNSLERILLANWTSILDFQKIILFTTQVVRDYNDFPVFEEDEIPKKGVQISLTRFTVLNHAFLIWIDYTVPKDFGFVIGTCEAILDLSGNLTLKNLIGQHLKQR